MSTDQHYREFTRQRQFEKTIAQYEDDINYSIHDFPNQSDSEDHEEQESPRVKEEKEELHTSEDGELLVLKLEADTFMVTPAYTENGQSEAEPNSEQLFSNSSTVSEIPDEEGSCWHIDSRRTKEKEPKPKKRHLINRSGSYSDDDSVTSKTDCDNKTEGRRNAGIQAPENKKKKKRIARNWEDESQPAQLNPAQEAELVVWFSQHPEYYWKMADGFKNTKAKREAMEKKAAELGISYDRLDRWHRTMRDAYTNARRKQAGRSGSKPLAPRERWVLQNFSFWEDKLHYKGVDDNEGMFTQKIAARTPSSKAASAVAAAAVDPFFVDEEDIAIGNIHPQVSSSDEEEEAAVQTARLDSIITSSQVRRQNQQSDGALAGSAGTIGAPHCQHPAQKRLVALDSSALQKALLKHSELAIRLGNDVTTLLKSTKQDPMVAYGMYLGSIPPTLEEELQDEFVARTTELMQEFIRRNRALQKQKAEKQQQVLQERQLRQQQQPKPPHIISTVTATSQPPLFQQQQRLSQHSPYQMPSQSLPCFNPYSTDEGDVPVCQWNS